MKILLIDNHVLFREGLISLLERHPDVKVIGEAEASQHAVQKAIELDPDVILMEIHFPEGNGFEVMEAILAHKPKVSIVVLTSQESEDLLFQSIRCGAKGYLLKNTPINKLVASLRALERGEAALSRSMTSKVLEEFRRQGKVNHKGINGYENLTLREIEVLGQLGSEASNQEIANRLYISENTVKVHVSKILAKLEMQNRREAGRFARRQGLSSEALGGNGKFG